MLDPKEMEVPLLAGGTKKFIISKFPAVAGREIVSQYVPSATPKLGDYGRNEELMLMLMCYVGVPVKSADGKDMPPLMLTTRQLIDNHVPDYEALMRIEFAMMEYNTSFFTNGKASRFFEGLTGKVQALIMQMLTDFSQRSKPKD